MSTYRARSRRTYGCEPIQLSKLNPADINMCPGVQLSIVCRECHSWHRVVGKTDLKVIQHGRDNGERCPGGNRQVQADLTPERWFANLRRQELDALPAETRRAARQHYKPLPAVPGPVHLMATPRPAVEHTASERTEQWKKLQPAVKDTNDRRADPLSGAIGPIRGIEAPRTTLRPAA
ncbi:hypothetical protein [Kitasatospora cathayae]|uniref:Uncharacterized protein n=1 Tax=Kitasatospora cathayae TaxID=3004092 RepID=A0ABY7QJ97_9ACTN|nr:hypothetical protein [Kitasatospora sp. HUAS 3-15]WBP91974.1 hypothetical protein O1G21_39990 [Kitasatospora sp. HUAS 3-15]